MPVSMKELFETVDAMDAQGFATYFTEDAHFRFGNAPSLNGRAAIASSIEDFFSNLKGLRHTIHDVWEIDDAVISEVEVIYTRLDGTEVQLPAATVARCDGDLMRDYRIYMDINPLFA